ncbi:MAG: hypothetical protein H6Q14_2845 [Bacteroidetes bacterium]|nr:hypothetical protein [Bacteroidota bacterium]
MSKGVGRIWKKVVVHEESIFCTYLNVVSRFEMAVHHAHECGAGAGFGITVPCFLKSPNAFRIPETWADVCSPRSLWPFALLLRGFPD